MKKKSIVGLFLTLILFGFCSCQKFLDQKPDQTFVVPSTLKDFEMMLDYYDSVNGSYPGIGEIMNDHYYLTDQNWASLTSETNRNFYLWKADDLTESAWLKVYEQILTFNIILDNFSKVQRTSENQETYDRIKGAALFLRAYYFQSLANLYAPPFDKHTSLSDMGIVLRLNSDFNEKSIRSTVKGTYDQIIKDLKAAAAMLPIMPLVKSRASRPAAYGALARTYLSMQEYDSAGVYADKCLSLYNELIDYNTLNVNSNAPFSQFNKEIIFSMSGSRPAPLSPNIAKITPVLYQSYHSDDLRKYLFFKVNTDGSFRFKGDYNGSASLIPYIFSGIVTDEMYLIRAESNARSGKIAAGMQDLNTLLKTRWKSTATFMPYTASNVKEAVQMVLLERRKELLYRGTGWVDLRRLRNEPDYAVIPKRTINGQTYELLPNSPRYTLQIPRVVIERSGILQNP